MSKHKKQQQEIEKAAEKEAILKAAKDRKSRGARIIITSVVAVMLLIIGGAVYYQTTVAPFQKTVIKIDNAVVRMDYFLKRVKMAGADPASMVEQLAYEQIVKMMAPRYGIQVSEADIDQELWALAATSNSENTTDNSTIEITEVEFKDWYRQQLKDTGLSDAEYKDIILTNLLANQLQLVLAENVPTKGEQVHLNIILSSTAAAADKVKARLDAGEDFATVAREVSLDTTSKEKGGDVGWMPRGFLAYDDVIFELSIGQASDPVPTGSGQYLVFMVSEKAVSRDIEEAALQVLKGNALRNWLMQEISRHAVEINYTEETQAWVTWQLSKG